MDISLKQENEAFGNSKSIFYCPYLVSAEAILCLLFLSIALPKFVVLLEQLLTIKFLLLSITICCMYTILTYSNSLLPFLTLCGISYYTITLPQQSIVPTSSYLYYKPAIVTLISCLFFFQDYTKPAKKFIILLTIIAMMLMAMIMILPWMNIVDERILMMFITCLSFCPAIINGIYSSIVKTKPELLFYARIIISITISSIILWHWIGEQDVTFLRTSVLRLLLIGFILLYWPYVKNIKSKPLRYVIISSMFLLTFAEIGKLFTPIRESRHIILRNKLIWYICMGVLPFLKLVSDHFNKFHKNYNEVHDATFIGQKPYKIGIFTARIMMNYIYAVCLIAT